jgi:hypothetical protein
VGCQFIPTKVSLSLSSLSFPLSIRFLNFLSIAWDDYGIVDAILNSISLCAIDLRSALLQKIVFMGVGSNLPGNLTMPYLTRDPIASTLTLFPGVQEAIFQGIKDRLKSSPTARDVTDSLQSVNHHLPVSGTALPFMGATVLTMSQVKLRLSSIFFVLS